MGSSCLAGAAIAARATVADTLSAAAASPATGPVTANPSTLIITVHFSPFQALHLKPKPDLKTGFGSGDKLTFHDPLFSHARQAGDEGGSCVIVDASQPLVNCIEVIGPQQGTITAEGLTGPPPSEHLAVTGGTGIYRNVGGESHPGGIRKHNGQATPHLLGFSPTGELAGPTHPGHPSRAQHGRFSGASP